MYETSAEVDRLQSLMEASHSRATGHLRSIISGSHHLTSARELLPHLEGMRVLSLATVTARGEPRVSAVDGHFLHGAWTFGTDGHSAKARHLSARPSASAAYIDGERLGFFTHGTVERLDKSDDSWEGVLEHWNAYYDSDPRTWGDDVRLYRLHPSWCVAYVGEA
ncbi:pyridoxamine 5'-phosphate oxidase family protein [Microbacterium suaedae]|uniref:pyridoxamine 5'-phosphate oxidase family protein n=1 Tax=Microbacterium suaedae TaxID=2067813 RepID=UPI000DA25685|nr:pyridoxamine 5'-phosphate oxidase family protein [Microbacterium suaedae]